MVRTHTFTADAAGDNSTDADAGDVDHSGSHVTVDVPGAGDASAGDVDHSGSHVTVVPTNADTGADDADVATDGGVPTGPSSADHSGGHVTVVPDNFDA